MTHRFSPHVRRLAVHVFIFVIALAIGFLCGRFEAHWRETVLQIFTVTPPLVEWFLRFAHMER